MAATITPLRSEHLLTVAEAAQRIRVNKDTVRRWILSGQLPAVRINARVVRIAARDLDALLTPKRDEPRA